MASPGDVRPRSTGAAVHGFGCLPDVVCGQRTDEVLVYSVPKTVSIRDRRLWCLKSPIKASSFAACVSDSAMCCCWWE